MEDSRLVVLNAVDAAEHGAEIATRTELTAARREAGLWHLDLVEGRTRRTRHVTARALVNAAGPWVADVARRVGGAPHAPVRLVKGSHIVVRRPFAHDRAYIFQNADGRVVFAIPYEQDFALIGTTELDFAGDPAAASISGEEADYLCAAASEYFRDPIRHSQIVASFAGVRPLFDDGEVDAKASSRDYVLKLDSAAGGRAPLVTVYGGKITTYRRLAERVLSQARQPFSREPAVDSDIDASGRRFPGQRTGRRSRQAHLALPELRSAPRATPCSRLRDARVENRLRHSHRGRLGPRFRR